MGRAIVVALLLVGSAAVAQEAPAENPWTLPGNSVHTIRVPQYTAITIHGADGRAATIDFGGEAVTYSGPLPVDEAARVFFNALHLRMQIEACGPGKEGGK